MRHPSKFKGHLVAVIGNSSFKFDGTVLQLQRELTNDELQRLAHDGHRLTFLTSNGQDYSYTLNSEPQLRLRVPAPQSGLNGSRFYPRNFGR